MIYVFQKGLALAEFCAVIYEQKNDFSDGKNFQVSKCK